LRGLDLTPADFLHLDLFPATVNDLLADSDLGSEFRVVVTDNHLYVFEDNLDGPVTYIKEALRDFSGTNKTGYRIETSFNVYHVKRAPNCGCGASLRGLHLFPDATYLRPND